MAVRLPVWRSSGKGQQMRLDALNLDAQVAKLVGLGFVGGVCVASLCAALLEWCS